MIIPVIALVVIIPIPLPIVVIVPLIVPIPLIIIRTVEWSWGVLELTITVHHVNVFLSFGALICNVSIFSTLCTQLLSLQNINTTFLLGKIRE